MTRIVERQMFLNNAEEVAKFLLGKVMVRKTEKEIICGRITELEIYKQNDSACHAYRGKTKRNAPLFDEGGKVYVYLCYGLHYILNIVCNQKGIAEGLMIRGIDNVFGSGRVGKILKVDKQLNEEDILSSEKIWLEDDGFKLDENKIKKFKRVGIDYAKQEDIDRLWRWRIEV